MNPPSKSKKFYQIFTGSISLAMAAGAAMLWGTPLGARLRASPEVGAAYAAEIGCIGVHIMGRDPQAVLREDLLPVNPLFEHVELKVEDRLVSASMFGVAHRSALYRPGLGCTLVGKDGVEALQRQAEGIEPMAQRQRPEPWPAGDRVTTQEWPSLAKALDAAMADGEGVRGRALIVAHNGHIVAERYGAGIAPETLLHGWSMSKSVTAALIGNLVGQGKLKLDDPAPVAAWGEGDPRRAITLRQLLAMTSGLQFSETYDPGDDATNMLYRNDDMAAYAASRKLQKEPGQSWAYSSGSTNILSKIISDQAGGTLAGTVRLARTRLFEPAGMTSALFSPDASGTLVGSSYLFMTARDWARFGQLYLEDGLLGWQRILPPGWVAQTRQPAMTTKNEKIAYNMQFWQNQAGEAPLRWPNCPPDLYAAEGHNGQILAIIPSAHTLILRMGWDTGSGEWDEDRNIAAILAALSNGE